MVELLCKNKKRITMAAILLAFYIGDGGLNGQVFPFDPTNLPFLNDQPYAFAPGGSGKSGVYPYSEWQLKLSGVYQFPWDISVGAFARYQQGYPYVLIATISDPSLPSLGTNSHLILVEPFGSRRFENIFTLDLQFEKGIDFGNYGRLALSANLFNVTNTNTIIRRTRSVASVNLNRIDELISPQSFAHRRSLQLLVFFLWALASASALFLSPHLGKSPHCASEAAFPILERK